MPDFQRLQNKAAFASLRESRRDYELSLPQNEAHLASIQPCIYLFFGG
jgi:hypothetical protein